MAANVINDRLMYAITLSIFILWIHYNVMWYVINKR